MDAFLLEAFEQRYEDLAKSIVIQASDDYKRYCFMLDTIDLRKYKDEEGRYKAMEKAKCEIKHVEIFFNSEWFTALSNLDGKKALAALEKTYKTEYYPVRMKEMLDETKTGRFRVNDTLHS